MSSHKAKRSEVGSKSKRLEFKRLIQIKQLTKQKSKEYHLEKLKELSEKSLGEKAQLQKPSDEQKEWVLFRLSHPETWPKVHENKIGDWKNWK